MNELERLKKKQIELLDEFTTFCKKNNLKYSLGNGTAIGAIRHKGYVPWDDDIDIIMPRNDYDKFCKVYHSEKYFLQNVYTDSDYPLPFGKLRNSNTTYIENNMKDLNINHGIYIDLYPLDYIEKKGFKRIKKLILCEMLWVLTMVKIPVYGYRKFIVRIINYFCGKNRLTLISRIEDKIKDYDMHSKNLCLTYLCEGLKSCKNQFSLRLFDEFLEVEFENNKYLITKEFDNYLTNKYGDYMKIPKTKNPPHYYYILDCDKSYLDYIEK